MPGVLIVSLALLIGPARGRYRSDLGTSGEQRLRKTPSRNHQGRLFRFFIFWRPRSLALTPPPPPLRTSIGTPQLAASWHCSSWPDGSGRIQLAGCQIGGRLSHVSLYGPPLEWAGGLLISHGGFEKSGGNSGAAGGSRCGILHTQANTSDGALAQKGTSDYPG